MNDRKIYPFNQITSVFLLCICILAFQDKSSICCRTKILKLKDGKGKDEIIQKLKSMHRRKLVLTSSVEHTKGQIFAISPLPVLTGKS